MIFKSPYQTTALKNHVTNNVVERIKGYKWETELFLSETSPKSERTKYLAATMVNNDIPQWAHPLEVEGIWYVDQRPCTKINMQTRGTIITNAADYNFNKIRNYLCALFSDNYTRSYLDNISSLPMIVFAGWITENIGKKLSLDHGTEYKISILSAIYYQSLFIESGLWNEDTKKQIALKINRGMRINTEDIFELLDQIEEGFTGIDSFCKYVVTLSQNVRTESINVPLLYTLIGGTWLGFNSRETACVALEHIPTFLAMLYASTAERGFNASTFTKLAHRKGKREGEEFIKKINALTLSFK